MITLLNHLKKEYGIAHPGDALWSHAVNNHEKLKRSLANPDVMIIESDIRISRTAEAVCAHPPETESDLLFTDLIDAVKKSRKPIKLDFRDGEIVKDCLEYLRDAALHQSAILNADILQGNGANPPRPSTVGFMALCCKYYPHGVLSLGWTTTADPHQGYTAKNIDDMLALCVGMENREITFPVRACLLPNSLDELKRLLGDRKNWTLSIWNNETVDPELREWIRTNTDPARTYYDFIALPSKESEKLW